MNQKKFKVSEVIILIVVTCIISLTTGFLLNPAAKTLKVNKANIKTDDEALNEFIKNYNYIIDNYYQDVDKKTVLNGALNGLLAALGDPYASYFDEIESDTFDKQLNGNFEGIGVEIINNDDGNIEIYSVFEDSPADEAGLKKGDVIKSVNDKEFLNKTNSELTSYIASVKYSELKVIIIRDDKEKELNIAKRNVVIKSVKSKIIKENEKKIGYIRVSIFAFNTAEQFKNALKELEEKEIDSLIIDLRDNTGGHLTAVENMISEFLDSSHVIYQMQKKDKKTKYYSTGNKDKKYKIVLLANGNSASASEVMIAALTEEYGATFVGEKTFGKGTVQELIDLKEKTEYKFTTKKWLTPKGNWINEKGIKPDVEVKASEDYIDNPTEENDNQLETAIEEAIKKH